MLNGPDHVRPRISARARRLIHIPGEWYIPASHAADEQVIVRRGMAIARLLDAPDANALLNWVEAEQEVLLERETFGLIHLTRKLLRRIDDPEARFAEAYVTWHIDFLLRLAYLKSVDRAWECSVRQPDWMAGRTTQRDYWEE